MCTVHCYTWIVKAYLNNHVCFRDWRLKENSGSIRWIKVVSHTIIKANFLIWMMFKWLNFCSVSDNTNTSCTVVGLQKMHRLCVWLLCTEYVLQPWIQLDFKTCHQLFPQILYFPLVSVRHEVKWIHTWMQFWRTAIFLHVWTPTRFLPVLFLSIFFCTNKTKVHFAFNTFLV